MTSARGFGPWFARAAALERLSDSDIATALRAMPMESRMLMHLADVRGLAYKEIAEITGIPAEAVASSLHQVRCQLGELAICGHLSAGPARGDPSPPYQRRSRPAGWRPSRLAGRGSGGTGEPQPGHLVDRLVRPSSCLPGNSPPSLRPQTECERAVAEMDSPVCKLRRTFAARFATSADASAIIGRWLTWALAASSGQSRAAVLFPDQFPDQQGAHMPAKPAKPAKPAAVKVPFALPAEVEADHVALCGEFNNWSPDDINLSRDADGCWRATVSLEPGRTYRYRYLLDGQRWENAWDADGYLPNPYGEDDSVIVVAGAVRAGTRGS